MLDLPVDLKQLEYDLRYALVEANLVFLTRSSALNLPLSNPTSQVPLAKQTVLFGVGAPRCIIQNSWR